MLSIHHRGTVEEPGLVLALDEAAEGQCTGVAFRVAPENAEATLAYLRERELVSAAYVERILPLAMSDGRVVEALAYVIERDHAQYCRFELEQQAQMIARSVGGRGPNTEYLYNTAQHLSKMGIRDADMEWLVTRVREIAG